MSGSPEKKRRNDEMVALWLAGRTHAQIAEVYEITKARVGHIIRRELEKRENARR